MLNIRKTFMIFLVIFHFYPKEKIYIYNKLVCNIYDKERHIVCIEALKQALNNELILTKVAYIEMNTKIRMEAKNDFEKDFFKLMNYAVFGKTMENLKNYRNIKLVTTDKRRNQLVSEPNYHKINEFSEEFAAIEMKKAKVKMNKPVYLGMSILILAKH